MGDAWAHDRPVVDGFLVRLSVAWSLGFAVLGARSSWSSRAHPLASCFVSLALMVSRISSVYLSKWHSSWRVRVREALSSWDRVLGRLVYLSRSSWARARTRSSGTSSRSSWSSRSSSSRSSSSRSSSSRSSFCVCKKSTCNTSREVSAEQRACTAARRVESAQVDTPHACVRLPVARLLVARLRAGRQQTGQIQATLHVCNVSITSETRRRAQARSVRIEHVVHECARARSAV